MMIENNGLITNENDSESPASQSEINNEDKLDEKQLENKKPNKRKQTFERKNIRYIIDDEKFGKDAKEAQKAEFERLKRVQEKEQNIRLQSLLSDDFHKLSKNSTFTPETFNKFIHNNYVKLAPSRLPPASALIQGPGYKKYNNSINKQYRVVNDDCVIYVDDSDDEHEPKMVEKTEIIEISDGEDEDDEKEDIIDQEKLDTMNVQRDEYGRILINKSHLSDEEDYFLSPKINANIKPHQVSGIRFLYDNLVESKKQFKEADGFGCILAHSMGLGKTIQIIGFLDILFRCVNAKSALVIVPINTLQNWQSEIDFWLPLNADCKDNIKDEPTTGSLRSFGLFVIRDTNKTIESRHAVIKQWMEQGGVLLIGYEMFRLLVTYRQNKIVKPKRKEAGVSQAKKKICIDIDLEEKRDGIYQDFLKALVNPGPEVVICDEGHRIKNSEASISKALKAVRTHRRVVMTGYPLQNNLTEYWCMVDFVRPNYLGSKHEFNNMFQRPIENGQCVDSTFEDRKLMQGRAHVLHELLEGFVQRRSHAVLKANLPPKWEYVIMIKMSPIQRKLYSSFMEQLLNGNLYNWAQNNTLRTYAMCCKIWNHPDILFRVLKEQKASRPDPDFDFDIDDELPNNSKSTSKSKPKSKIKENKKSLTSSNTISSPVTLESNEEDNSRLESDGNFLENSNKLSLKENGFSNSLIPSNKIPANFMSYSSYLESVLHKDNDNVDPYSWITDDTWLLANNENYKAECSEHSGKIIIFLSLMEESIRYGDKMLVFSQSLLTLDLIEVFLKQSKLPDNNTWEKNRTYFRLDGSTSATERERMIKSFNEPGSEAFLFLLSTRAGCLGINLIGANRVIVFDASWNPCHDCQAVCRVYRYGQVKPCFIYRLVTDNTIEKKIYDRQVTKQGISDRVVDESNPGQQFTRSQVQVLVQYEDIDIPSLTEGNIDEIKRGCGDEDPILGRILENHATWVTKVPFTHESLLIDRKDYRLTRREKRKAKERYELDKRQSLYYQKNSYSDYYIKTTVPVNEAPLHNRPPISAYRSSILPTLSNNPSALLNNNSARYQLNKNLIRPPHMMSRPNSALLREIEQARLRCGFTKTNPHPFPIAVSDDEDDQISVRKKPKLNSEPDSIQKSTTIEPQIASDISKIQSNPIKTKADSSSELKTDKSFRVIKINATTELTFPATPSVVNSQAGESSCTKISAGEPLEIICTSKGKFLRVTRTGDLFAIKDSNKEKVGKSDSNNTSSKETRPESRTEPQIPNIIPQNTDDVIDLVQNTNNSTNNSSLMNLFDIKEPENKPSESVNIDPAFYTPQYLPAKSQPEETIISIANNCSTSNVNYSVAYEEPPSSSPMMTGLFSNPAKPQDFQLKICCSCKLSENPNNYIRGCICGCHVSNHQQGMMYNVLNPQQPVYVSQFPQPPPPNSQIFYSPSSILPQQYVMNSDLSSVYSTPQFYDDRSFNMMTMTNQNHPEHNWPITNDRFPMEYLDHGSSSLSADQISKSNNNNPIYSSYDFSDL